MESIDKLCVTIVKVIGTMAIIGVANAAGVFNPIKKKLKQWKAEAEAESCE